MSTDFPDPVSNAPVAGAPEAAAEAVAGEAGAQAPGKGAAKTQFTSLEDLKLSEPDLYKGIMEGIAGSIIGSMRRFNERFKKLMRQGRER